MQGLTVKYSHKTKLILSRIKSAASTKLRSFIKHGFIKRPDSCEECSVECKPDGHHEDYSEPLKVKWLCKKCHSLRHKEIRRLGIDLNETVIHAMKIQAYNEYRKAQPQSNWGQRWHQMAKCYDDILTERELK